jgi:peptide/nickel transport system permease protein
VIRRTPHLAVGSALVAACGAAALLPASWLPHDPLAINPQDRFADSSWRHPLGTDALGRDVLSLVAAGARATLGTALGAVAIAMVMGVLLGVAAATWPRAAGTVVRHAGAIALALPSLLVALVLVAATGPGAATAAVAIGAALSAGVARVTSDEAGRILSSDFVAAARTSGAGPFRIALHHLLPNLRASLLVQASGAFAVAILGESTLSYLGLGTRPPSPSWGRMLAESQQYLVVDPLVAVWPGAAVALAILGFGLLGDGIRDATDPARAEGAR